VIAPLLIIKRVANRSALTGDIIVTGTINSLKFGSGGSGSDDTLPGGSFVSSVDSCSKNSGELGVGVGVEATIDLHRDSKV